MSPTICRAGAYRFFLNRREGPRMHIHVNTADGTAKFWLEPIVALDDYYNLSTKDIRRIETIVKERENEFKSAWRKYFSQ